MKINMAEKTKKTVSTTTSTSIREEKKKEIPKGAKIISKSVRTETEEIENGYLISKHYDVSYEVGGNKDWTYFTKRWYSKEDPLEINIKDKALADAFEES
jgi:hypothetical protein